jgi:hypothetical protein
MPLTGLGSTFDRKAGHLYASTNLQKKASIVQDRKNGMCYLL